MNPSNSLMPAAASGSVSLALLVIINWILSLYGVTIPPDVQQAAGTILTVLIHWMIGLPACAKAFMATLPTQNQENKNV